MSIAAKLFEDLRSLPVSAAVLDSEGVIVSVNEGWMAFASRNGLAIPDFAVGRNYLDYCSSAPGPDGAGEQIRNLIEGRLDVLTLVYPCHSPDEQRWFVLVGIPLSTERPRGVALMHVNLTELLPGGEGPQIGWSGRLLGSVERTVADTLSSQLAGLASEVPAPGPDADPLHQAGLTMRQVQILRLLGQGRSNAEIARQLFRSPNTIKLHVSAILQRLNLKNRTQAALFASKALPEAADGPV